MPKLLIALALLASACSQDMFPVSAGVAGNRSFPPPSGTPAVDRTTSYANPGGTGDRRGMITVTQANIMIGTPLSGLIDGINNADSAVWMQGTVSSSTWVQFDFGHKFVIDEAKFYQGSAVAQGTWKWQGSNDASAWTDLGSSFALGGATSQTITAMAGNTTEYRYYRILGVSGTANNGPFTREYEFKISTAIDTTSTWSNALSTGNRTSSITVTTNVPLSGGTIDNLVDGGTGANSTDSIAFLNTTIDSTYFIKFDLGSAKVIDDADFWQETAGNQANWKWQGSNDNSSWTDIGTSFLLGADIRMACGHQLVSNTTAYRYYRLSGISGTNNASPWVFEFQFRVK